MSADTTASIQSLNPDIFFAFIVAVLIFALGGGVSIVKGITAYQSASTAELGDPTLNYIIILLAMAIESTSLAIALRQVYREKGDQSLWQFIRKGKDPSHFTVVLEDSAAEAGLLVALIGVFGAHSLNNPPTSTPSPPSSSDFCS